MNSRPYPTPPDRQLAGEVSTAELDALVSAARTLVALSAHSVAALDSFDLSQIRALIIVDSLGTASLSELARAARIHLSTASRLCDRLVGMDLLDRVEEPANRRQLALTLTPSGHRVVRQIRRERRKSMRAILARLPEASRIQLASLLREFVAAGGEPARPDLWASGWAT